MDKFLEIFRLEPVESLKPACKRCISGKVEFVIRILVDILTASVLCYISGASELLKSLFLAFNGIFIVELLWGGFKRFEYVQDIVLHSIALVIFSVITVVCNNHLVGLALMGVAKCFLDFEYRNICNMENIDAEVQKDWEGYSARNCKMSFVLLSVSAFVILKTLNVV